MSQFSILFIANQYVNNISIQYNIYTNYPQFSPLGAILQSFMNAHALCSLQEHFGLLGLSPNSLAILVLPHNPWVISPILTILTISSDLLVSRFVF